MYTFVGLCRAEFLRHCFLEFLFHTAGFNFGGYGLIGLVRLCRAVCFGFVGCMAVSCFFDFCDVAVRL